MPAASLVEMSEGKKRKKLRSGPVSRVLFRARARRRPFIYDADCSAPQAAYPEVVADRTSPQLPKELSPCLALLRVGFA